MIRRTGIYNNFINIKKWVTAQECLGLALGKILRIK
jgi:hypothetical protein